MWQPRFGRCSAAVEIYCICPAVVGSGLHLFDDVTGAHQSDHAGNEVGEGERTLGERESHREQPPRKVADSFHAHVIRSRLQQTAQLIAEGLTQPSANWYR
jgi:hypothetical protein